jgi:predicted acetyltransferase
VAAALAARRYGTDDRLVLEVTDPFRPANDGRYLVHGGPDGADAARTDAPPDLTLGVADLGALVLGGVAATSLARADRVGERTLGALRRADAFFASGPAPWCGTDF